MQDVYGESRSTPPPALQSDWRVVQRGYYAHVLGEAPHHFKDPVEAVRKLKKDNSVSGGQAVCLRLMGGQTVGRGAARGAASMHARRMLLLWRRAQPQSAVRGGLDGCFEG